MIVDPVHHFGDRTGSAGFVVAAQRQGADLDALHVAIPISRPKKYRLWPADRCSKPGLPLAGTTRDRSIGSCTSVRPDARASATMRSAPRDAWIERVE